MDNIALKTMREMLVRAAKNGGSDEYGVVYYGDLMNAIGLDHELACDRGELGGKLLELNDIEVDAGRPILGVLAVNKSSCAVSPGFFSYIDERGLRIAGEGNDALVVRLMNDVYSYSY